MKKVEKRGPKRITVLYPLLSNPSAEGEKKQRVAAYCRVSSGSEEQLTSYRAQIHHYENHIKGHPDYIFAGIYADEGISGTSLSRRDAFNRMLSDAREGKLDLIMTKSLSRFGRNTLDALNSIRELKALGVDVYFEKENLHTMQAEGEMLITLISAVAENESFTQSDNVKWGIRRKYERGNIKSIPTGKFLGYDKDDDGNLVINEPQAKVVRRIYQEFLDGFGTYQIAQRLTKEKAPMAFGGKEWCASHIKEVLTNEKFKGDTLFSKTYNADPLTKRRVKNTGQLPQYYLEDTHPAIIDKRIWELVQLEFQRQERFVQEHNMNKYHHHREKIPCSGKIICRVCGRIFRLREGTEGKYWRCPKPRSKTDPSSENDYCENSIKMKADKIEAVLVMAWNEIIQNRTRYEKQWQANLDGDDMLLDYRTQELMKLMDEFGTRDAMSYELMLRTISHIEVDEKTRIRVIFLAGIMVELDGKDFVYEKKPYRETKVSEDSWIAQRRMELGLSQRQLGEKVGVKYIHILRIEKGSNASKETAMRLGEVLGVHWTRWFEE